eukprot:scaffold193391_cov32-Tisochrysis_lutea.AAC.2
MEGDCIHSLVVAVGSSAATRPEGAMEEEPPLFPGKMRERCVDATAVGGGRKRALAAIAVERAGAGIDARESIPRTPLSQLTPVGQADVRIHVHQLWAHQLEDAPKLRFSRGASLRCLPKERHRARWHALHVTTVNSSGVSTVRRGVGEETTNPHEGNAADDAVT